MLPERPGWPTARAIRFVTRVVWPLVRRVHRVTAGGEEHLPPEGPFVLVANHPPSVGGGEFLAFGAWWAQRFHGERPLAAFVHALGYDVWPLSVMFRELGAIPSTYAAAEDCLAKGSPILVFPGGDYESFKPFFDPRAADFGGREGFLRIARAANVPVVPLSIRGQSSPSLFRARFVAWLFVWPRATGVKVFGVTALGAIGAVLLGLLGHPWLAFLWMASPLALLPWFPSKVHLQFGPPLPSTATREEVERAISRARSAPSS